MIIATAQRMSLEEFLCYEAGTGHRYELVDGYLVDMGAESTKNTSIAIALAFYLAQQFGIPPYRLATKHWVKVSSDKVTARDPDLLVHSEASYAAIEAAPEALLKPEHPLPLLVVEVVSPGKPGSPNYDRDYVEKRAEYAARGIPEFWLIDPLRQVVIVLSLVGSRYEEQAFMAHETILSPTFPEFNLTAAQILTPGQG